MLNNSFSVKASFNTPATGIIQKSHNKSFFLRCHYNSGLAANLYSPNAKYNEKKIVILQSMLIHAEWILVEVVNESDFSSTEP